MRKSTLKPSSPRPAQDELAPAVEEVEDRVQPLIDESEQLLGHAAETAGWRNSWRDVAPEREFEQLNAWLSAY